jgi:hypothetical protein
MDMDTIFQDAGLIDDAGKPTSAAVIENDPNDESIFKDLEFDNDPPKPEARVDPLPDANADNRASDNEAFDPNRSQAQSITPEQARAVGVQRIQQQIDEALIHGLSLRDDEGKAVYTREQLLEQFAPKARVMVQQLELAVAQHQMAPYARRASAEILAKEHGVKVDDIISEPTIERMETAAKTIAKYSRQDRFDSRRASGADAVEGGRGMSAAAAEAYESLSPTAKIAFGLRRGDR